MIPDRAIRAALVNLHQGACACHEICVEGGAAADAVCCCFCHAGQPLTASQRVTAAQRIAPRHDDSRLAAVMTLVLDGIPLTTWYTAGARA